MEILKGLRFLIESVIALILSSITTIFLKVIGFAFAPFWMLYFIKSPKKLIKFIDTWIGGLIQNVAWLIMQLALFLDYLWNIGGSAELLEDYSTSKEESYFNKPRISVSCAIGHSEFTDDSTKHVRGFSRFLNKLFREKTHCISSYKKYLLDKEFNKNEFGNIDRLM